MRSPVGIERRRVNERGLTLIEVLLGVVILGVAVAPVAALLGGTLSGSETHVADARSLHLAQGKLEELMALDFEDLKLGTSLSDRVAAPDSIDRYVLISMTRSPNSTRLPRIRAHSHGFDLGIARDFVVAEDDQVR